MSIFALGLFLFAHASTQMPAQKVYVPQPGDVSPEGFNLLHRDLALIYSGSIYEHNLKGVVREEQIKQRKDQLVNYLSTLGKIKKEAFSKWNLEHQKSFLINAHNAQELLRAADPTVKSEPLFTAKEVAAFVKQEPRILLMLHCSAAGCPEFRNRVVNFRNLEEMLEQSAYRFFMDKDKNQFDSKTHVLRLSGYLSKYAKYFPAKSIAHYFKNDAAAKDALASGKVKILFAK